MGVPSITRVSSFTSFNCDGLCPLRTRPRRCCRPLGAINAMESARDRVRIAGSGKRAGARASGRTPGVASSGERRARRLFREKPEEMRRGAGHGGFTGDTDGLGTRTGKRGRGAMMTGHRIIPRSRGTIRVVGSMAMSRALTISLGAVIVIAQSHRHRRRSLDRKSEYCDQEQEASDQDAHGRGVYGPVFRVCKAAGLLSIPEPFRCNLPTLRAGAVPHTGNPPTICLLAFFAIGKRCRTLVISDAGSQRRPTAASGSRICAKVQDPVPGDRRQRGSS